MLRISKLTDYGVVLATELAAGERDGARPVRELAERTGIPAPTVSKVLKQLGRAGVTRATRGALGGYALARPATETSVAAVIIALEGPIAVTECTDTTVADGCEHEPRCGVRANWQRINDAMQRALEDISLAEMASSRAPRVESLVTLRLSRPAARAASS